MKSLLLHLGNEKRKNIGFRVACSLARRFGAHVLGYYSVPVQDYSGLAMGQAPIALLDSIRNQALEGAERHVAWFEHACQVEGLMAEHRIGEGDPVSLLMAVSRTADLAIVHQDDPASPSPANIAAVSRELVLNAACPVLLLPYAGKFDDVGNHILIAWNNSREASRAMRDALPILKQAEKVTILTVNPPRDESVAAADVAQYLARHDVNAIASQTATRDIDISSVLVSAISDYDADLLVMGAWGRSRTRELVFGGATRGVLDQMTVPVFMSH